MTIEQLALEDEIRKGLLTKKPEDIITKMAETNSWEYNIDKTIEELFELGEVLMKRKLKGSNWGATNKQIIDEVGDVEIRIRVLRKLLGEESINSRVEEKLAKFKGFFEQGKYIGSI